MVGASRKITVQIPVGLLDDIDYVVETENIYMSRSHAIREGMRMVIRLNNNQMVVSGSDDPYPFKEPGE